MFYAGIAIIVAGIMAALAPIAREWYAHRRRKEREERENRERR